MRSFKKLAAILLSVIAAFGALTAVPHTANAAETTTEAVQADTTYTSGSYTYKLLDDGTVDISDAATVQKYVAQIIAEFTA